MDVNMLRTVLTTLFFLIFIGIVWWAFTRKNTRRFSEAANLPFADDDIDRRSDLGNPGTRSK